MNYTKKSVLLSPEQELILFKKFNRASNTDLKVSIINKIVEANTGLVLNIAKKYTKSSQLDLDDLIAEGFSGLLIAINRFDYKRGNKFSTFASWWVLQSISRAVMCANGAISSSFPLNEIANKVSKEKSLYFNKYGEYPSVEYLAVKCETHSKRVLDAITNSQSVLSLDLDYSSEANTKSKDPCGTPSDFIEDKNSMSCDEELDIIIRNNIIDECLQSLTEREKFILIHYYGLQGQTPKTLDSITKLINVTSRERVRQLINSALKKLRNTSKLKDLSYFI